MHGGIGAGNGQLLALRLRVCSDLCAQALAGLCGDDGGDPGCAIEYGILPVAAARGNDDLCGAAARPFDRLLGLSKDRYHLGTDRDTFFGEFAPVADAARDYEYILATRLSERTPLSEGVRFLLGIANWD